MVYAEEIEGAVLGACLLERSAQAVVLKSLRAEMFYLTAHRVVFEAINALYARGAAVDMLTVTEELRSPETARRNLYRWMYRCPSIREGLAALGHDKHRKFFLKPEVEVIVRGLGEP